MRRRSLFVAQAALAAAGLLTFLPPPAFAWQAPGDMPTTPRVPVDVDDGEQKPPAFLQPQTTSAATTSGDATPEVKLPPRIPAPAARPTVHPVPLSDDATGEAEAQEQTSGHVPSTAGAKPRPQLKATIFKEVEPGATTRDQLEAAWGAPAKEKSIAGGTTLTFSIAPFPRVDTTIHQGVVSSIVVFFKRPIAPQVAIEQLGLTEITSVEVTDVTGRALGRTFPERGVTFGYASGEEKSLVAHVLLEPLSSEPFVLRVKDDRRHRWQQNLADLETALSLTPTDHRAWWLKAELLAQIGDQDGADQAIGQALKFAPEVPTYQLTAARLLGRRENDEGAISATRHVAKNSNAPPIVKARAHLQLGDLLADSRQHDYHQALTHHQKAIELAVPLATDDRLEVRRAAKRVLVDAHLAVAQDIAKGRWKKQNEVVPLWLERSRAFVDEMLENEMDYSSLPLIVSCKSLAAYAWLKGEVDPAPAAHHAQAFADDIIEDSGDPLYKRHIRWHLSKALVDAVDVQRARGKVEKAKQYAEDAEQGLQDLLAAGFRSDEAQFQLSRLYFLLGSMHAVQLDDHRQAVEWFAKAIDDLSRPEPDADLLVTAQRGEWLVSMGISYWHTGDQRRGLKLTEVGAGLIEAVQREGTVGAEKLAVPYNNLAFMHGELGNRDKASHFAQLAARIDTETKSR